MRNGLIGLAGTLVLASTMAMPSCGNSSGGGGATGVESSSSGASSSSSGAVSSGSSASSSEGGGTSCSNVTTVTPCGGNVVGTWTAVPSCLNVTGQVALSAYGLGCPSASVTGSLSVTGTWTANANGTYSDDTTTSGSEQLTLGASCLVVSSTPVSCSGMGSYLMSSLGYSSVTCTDAGTGGCNCSATVQQTGGMGLVSVGPSTNGTYTTAGNVITTSSQGPQYTYCASGNSMIITPESTSPTLAGAVTLQSTGSFSSSSSSSSGGSGSNGSSVSTSGSGSSSSGSSGSSGSSSSSGSSGSSSSGSKVQGPCDIYNSGGAPCVAAHSTLRALFGAYAGKLYQVRNGSGTTQDISAVTAGGIADSAAQDTFCSGTTCAITMIYDQSGKANDLTYEGAGSPVGGISNVQPASATQEPIKLGGKRVYGVWLDGGKAYWVDGSKNGMPLNANPQGIYMVTSGTHSGSGCCFDYGNGETTRKYAYPGAMDAINFSSTTLWGTGAGSGPWVMADLEAGLYAQGGGGKSQNDPTQTSAFVTAVEKNNGTTQLALRGGDATTGALSTYYEGALPPGYNPMKKQGAIVLGSGGDCCQTNMNLAVGTFYEGAIVAGYPSDATENAVQVNIVAAGYSK